MTKALRTPAKPAEVAAPTASPANEAAAVQSSARPAS